jgi:ABC-type proline/glycine betaine transport system permease subunit
MPAFVYLLPALVLFSLSRFTAIVAAVTPAIAPVVGSPRRASALTE